MNEDRFAKPCTSSAGVRWEPTDYKSIDQTPYLDYLDRQDPYQHELLTPNEIRQSMGLPSQE